MTFGQWADTAPQEGETDPVTTNSNRTCQVRFFLFNIQTPKELDMGIRMMPEQFSEHRRQDPKRAAEARVFDALQSMDLDGCS